MSKKRAGSPNTSNVSLSLDKYDDIFSYFDPRDYSQRALSDDFLSEAKRATREKTSKSFELRLIIPKDKRAELQERVIKKRLKSHFNRHFNMIKEEKNKIKKQGSMFIIFGIALMFIATLILVKYESKGIMLNFLIILLEPGGWFLFWEGLDLIIFAPEEISRDFEFYRKMSACKINFY